jgi:rRNA maturation RNase YbeY
MQLVPLFSRRSGRKLSPVTAIRCARMVMRIGRHFGCFGEVGVTFVDNLQMSRLGHGATDVLAFPYDELGPSLGDIFINLDYLSHRSTLRARERRTEELVTHAMLHLCGNTHDDYEDYSRMRRWERRLLGRPCLPVWNKRVE